MTDATRRNDNGSCPVCAAPTRVFFEARGLPVFCNVLWPSRAEARDCARGDMVLGFCDACGLISNLAFDASLLEYGQEYDNSLHFSPRFQAYARALAERLIDDHGLRDKDVIEVGSGKGDFLVMLCELGGNRGIGFDPSYEPTEDHASLEGVRFVQDLYSEKHADAKGDLVCCRHVLEHIERPGEMLAAVRRAIGDRPQTVVFFEVPNTLHTLRNLAIWDIIYEHCVYFTPVSMANVFESTGFRVTSVTPEFENQYLCLEAKPSDGAPASPFFARDEVDALARDVASFSERHDRQVAEWRDRLARMAAAGRRAVVWGAGSKGVTFLNVMGAGSGALPIEHIVDINPRKQGKHVAGSGQEIVPPEALPGIAPDEVIVMNPIYTDEIRGTLADLGVRAEVVVV